MKLLMINETLDPGGAERMMVVAANVLAAQPETEVALAASEGPLRQALDSRVSFADLPRFRYFNLAAITSRLTRLISEFQPDLIHSQGATLAVLAGIARERAGSLATRILTHHSHPVRRVPPWAADRLFKRYVDHMVAITAGKYEALLGAGWPASRLSLIPNCLFIGDPRRWDRAAVRQELGLPAGEGVVAMAGRLVPDKGWDVFAAALQEAAGLTHRHLTGLVIGEGPERRRLEALARRAQPAVTLRLLGFQSDVPRLLAASDVFLFPSRHEVLPVALIEAAAMGVPIVASRIPGNAEVVVDGSDGYLVADGPREYGERLASLLEDPGLWGRMSENARRMARERFSQEQVMPRLLALYRDLGRPAPAAQDQEAPPISVVIPCRNEERFIADCLRSLLSNDYPQDRLEILVVDGMSRDRTREIVRGYMQGSARIRLLDNPAQIVPTALNVGIAQATGDFIMRIDAHASYPRDYIRRCLRLLRETGAANAGGRVVAVPGQGPWGLPIARVTASRFGVGNSAFRVGSAPGFVDTVTFGIFSRSLFARVGGFDERLTRNQDNEFNSRLRRHGLRIAFDPSIRVLYHNQETLRGLLRQACSTSRWNLYALWLHPASFSWRRFVPAAFVLYLAALPWAALGLGGPAAAAALAPLLAYLAIAAALSFGGGCSLGVGWRTLLTYGAYHVCYGAGAWLGLLDLATGRWKERLGKPLRQDPGGHHEHLGAVP